MSHERVLHFWRKTYHAFQITTDDPSRLGLAEKKPKIGQASFLSLYFFPAPSAPRMHPWPQILLRDLCVLCG